MNVRPTHFAFPEHRDGSGGSMTIGMPSDSLGAPFAAGAPFDAPLAERPAAPTPAEIDLILSAIEAGRGQARPPVDRRRFSRSMSYRVSATLQLFSDGADAPPRMLYTRDVDPRGLGFISTDALPVSHGGIMRLVDPIGRSAQIHCTIIRCREAVWGWHEGAVSFNVAQEVFAAGN